MAMNGRKLQPSFSLDEKAKNKSLTRQFSVDNTLKRKGENINQNFGKNYTDGFKNNPLVVKKAQQNKKSETKKIDPYDTIFKHKEELIYKLQKLLKDEPALNKTNLEIFLAHNKPNVLENQQENFENKVESNEATKLFKFRKHGRSLYSSLDENTQRNFKEEESIVVEPVVENLIKERKNFEKTPISTTSQPISNVVIKTSAAAKRNLFKNKGINSAFNTVISEDVADKRPPLQRSSSAPLRPQIKPKLFPNRKRNKSAKTRSLKKRNSVDLSSGVDVEDGKTTNDNLLPNNPEVETMVSLVSPASSDAEEPEIEPVQPLIKLRRNSNTHSKYLIWKEENRSKSIHSSKKMEKSVSFQQSTMHSIRSFSASLPARRRCSIAPPNFIGIMRKNAPERESEEKIDYGGPLKPSYEIFTNQVLKELDAQTEHSPCPLTISVSIVTPDMPKQKQDKIKENDKKINGEKKENDKEDLKINLKGTETDNENLQQTDFQSPKEKECWETYSKMTNKGIDVNYDTLLRGMLTPTEYRNRMHNLKVLEKPVQNE